jgi:glycosyltransferase involved in cell wall biosynthesis
MLSVIVCTHDRWPFLQRCLAGLAAQQSAPGRFEVLVVDNASSDATATEASAFCEARAGFRYLREERLGLSVARNRGMDEAAGAYLAYIDDDAVPYPDWVARLLDAFERKDLLPHAVGGEIEPEWGAPPPPWLTPILRRFLTAEVGWSKQAIWLERPQWICETNAAYRRDVLRHYGRWPEDLGRRGSSLLSNENIVNQRLLRDGGRILFDPAIRVRHHIHAERLTAAWLYRRAFWQGVSEAVVARRYPEALNPERKPEEMFFPVGRGGLQALFERDGDPAHTEQRCLRLFDLGFLLQWYGLVEG